MTQEVVQYTCDAEATGDASGIANFEYWASILIALFAGIAASMLPLHVATKVIEEFGRKRCRQALRDEEVQTDDVVVPY